MKARERKQFAAAWLRKYGAPIDQPRSSLRLFGPPTVAQGRRARAVRALSPTLLEVIAESRARARDALYRARVHGTATTYRELELQWRRAVRCYGHGPEGAEPYGIRRALAHWLWAGRRVERELRKVHREARFARTAGRADDYYLWLAAAGVAAWIKDQHRNRRGEPDQRICWPDVAGWLEWWGHDLSSVATDKAKAVRKGVRRFVEHHPALRDSLFGRAVSRRRTGTFGA